MKLTKCEKKKHLSERLEKCIIKVKRKEKVKNPWAVCRSSISKKLCPIKKKQSY